MDYAKESLRLHKEWNGKISINVKCPVNTKEELALAYTPGVAQPCLEIQKDPNKSYSLTWKKNCVAVITDGSAVLGLGNIGPAAGMPVMEGKAALFKAFGDVDAIPLCIKSNNVDEIVNTIYLLSDSFGGINLEDISSPRCIEIEERLKKLCDIPVFHDDQHGTAIVVAAAIINATKLTNVEIHSSELYNINVTNNKYLRRVDLENCVALGTVTATGSSLNLSNCKYLSYCNVYNTALTEVQLNTSGGSLIEIYYPKTIQNVQLIKQRLLETIGLPYGSGGAEIPTSLYNIDIEECPSIKKLNIIISSV